MSSSIASDHVGKVAEAIVQLLRADYSAGVGVAELLKRLDGVSSNTTRLPSPPPHTEDLDHALARLRASSNRRLARIGDAIDSAAGSLPWAVDDGNYYSSDAPVSESYRHGNMNALLAEGDDFAMGLFLLVPDVEYSDHRHVAPELYLNLNGPSEWRFDFGPWVEMQEGSIVWNESGRVHATRSGGQSWLSFWAWLRDIDQLCEVVEPPTA